MYCSAPASFALGVSGVSAARSSEAPMSARTFPAWICGTIAGASVQDMVPALISAMQRHGVARPSIRIRSVETLGRNQASGKLKRFVPLSSSDARTFTVRASDRDSTRRRAACAPPSSEVRAAGL